MNINIGEVYNITAPAGYDTQVWVEGNSVQDVLLTTINAGETYQAGPYLNTVNLRFVTQVGEPTIARVGTGVTPITLKSVLNVDAADAVADATDANDIVTQFNALLASLRAAGFVVDDIPATIEFTAVTDAELETLTLSNIDQVTGITDGTVISIDGEGAYEYRILGNASGTQIKHDWSATQGTIDNGEYVQVRLTSSDANETEVIATLTVGVTEVEFSVTTVAA